MVNAEARIEEALRQPDTVIQSRSDLEVRLYHRFYAQTPVGAKYLCAVVRWRSDNAFLITAYFTDRPKRGAVLWTKE
jgi:molybdopterin synthase catalytic subunit